MRVVSRRLRLHRDPVLEWDQEGECVVVRRAGKYSSKDIHKSLFPKGAPKARSIEEMRAGIGARMRKRHARP